MIYTLKHTYEISNIINSLPNNVKYLINTGMPLAGAAAAAIILKGDKNSLYFKDYDFFPLTDSLNSSDYQNLFNAESLDKPIEMIATENAFTYIFDTYAIQIIKPSICHPSAYQGSNKTLNIHNLISNFDFINAAALINKTNIFYHKYIYACANKRELEILNPWTVVDSETAHKQILRFIRYQTNWGYSLSQKSAEYLYDLFLKYPVIEIKNNQTYGSDSNSNEVVEQITKTNNIWESDKVKKLIRNNLYFKQLELKSSVNVDYNSFTEQESLLEIISKFEIDEKPKNYNTIY